ncbi:hypothetical protein [uncultured Gammaproteobacteria bacterium]|nr:hypothetical protein [uncultured Gammaproteobacteria bacterium]CAC9958824.1 hypothetical protein [uncultured Gammaproteobacteria bacterium]
MSCILLEVLYSIVYSYGGNCMYLAKKLMINLCDFNIPCIKIYLESRIMRDFFRKGKIIVYNCSFFLLKIRVKQILEVLTFYIRKW